MKASTLGLLLLALPAWAGADPPEVPDRTAAARQVMAAVVRASQRNAGRPRPLTGDDLTAMYCREAAAAAAALPAEHAVPAYLLALGLALDDSTLLRTNPLLAGLCRKIESDEERKVRLATLGQPTWLGRRDWCQHFTVSCTLTQAVGALLAEQAGLLKEQLDMRPGGSGFSFGDLSADLAGVEFATRLQKGTLKLEDLARKFRPADYVPDPAGLREGLSAEQFARDYGSVSDQRFRTELERLRRRIRELPAFREGKADK
jgi:hypothetical protein